MKKGWGRVARRENYKPFPLGDTSKISNEEWLKWREHGSHYNANDESDPYYVKRGYGGSTIAGIFNLSHFTCAKEVFDKKSGINPKAEIDYNPEAKELGHIYEPAIANAFAYWWSIHYPKVTLEVINDTRMFRHGKKNPDGTFTYPWALANTDRLIKVNGEYGILEIKRTSSRNITVINNWKRGIPPRDYEMQVRYYLAIMNLQFAYIVCSWGHELSQMAVVRIDRDYAIEDAIMKGVAEFDEMVENGVEPDYEDCNSELLANYYFRYYGVISSNNKMELSEKYRSTIQRAMRINKKIEETQAQLKMWEEKQAEVSNILMPLYENASYGTFDYDEDIIVEVKLKQSLKRQAYDEERLKNEHPDVYDAYLKFDATRFKEIEPTLAEMYALPRELSDASKAKNNFTFKVKNKKRKIKKGAYII